MEEPLRAARLLEEETGYEIASRVDPNVSNDVCTFCRHATFGGEFMDPPTCALGHQGYFRSLSNMGPIWVSNCEKGELRAELAALDTSTSSRVSGGSPESFPGGPK